MTSKRRAQEAWKQGLLVEWSVDGNSWQRVDCACRFDANNLQYRVPHDEEIERKGKEGAEIEWKHWDGNPDSWSTLLDPNNAFWNWDMYVFRLVESRKSAEDLRREIIKQAFEMGNPIEWFDKANPIWGWLPCPRPMWFWDEFDYRVKPEKSAEELRRKAVEKAYTAGARIEIDRHEGLGWQEVYIPGWRWDKFDYRVKPEKYAEELQREAVKEAYEAGQKIEYRLLRPHLLGSDRVWRPIGKPNWDWNACEYRVALEPEKLRPWTPEEALGKKVYWKSTPDIAYLVHRVDRTRAFVFYKDEEYSFAYKTLLEYANVFGTDEPCGTPTK